MTVGRSPAKFKQLDDDESSESQDAWPTRGNIKMFFSWHFDGEPYPIQEIQKFLIPVLFTLWRWIAFHTIAFLNGSDPKSLSTPKSESINLLNPAPGLFKINVIKYDAQANLKHTSTNFTRDRPVDPPVCHMILLAVKNWVKIDRLVKHLLNSEIQPATIVVC